MREYLKLLQTSALFEGISEDEILQLLVCLNANIRVFGRGETVLRLGEDLEHIGLVLNGRVLVFRDGLLGERTLIAQVSKGGLFAEALAFARISELPVSVEALEKSEIL
ncbi:MAG TPA: cyclic nucleotide-binding domain-containing protein, partial [Clostridia bacterium]|nr:cyclic nucleotide-binding domain-containing protein [Clostridia bacterium]